MKPLTYKRGAWLVCALTLLCASQLAWASLASAKTTTNPDSFENTPLNLGKNSGLSTGGTGASIVTTLLALLVVLAIIYGLYWVMKKARGSSNPATGYGLEQLATLPMGTNRSLALVRVGAELHLLGISEHGITGIRVYSEEEAYELGLPLESEDDPSSYGAGLPPIQRLISSFKRFTLR